MKKTTILEPPQSESAPAWSAPSGGAWTYRYAGGRAHTPALTDDGELVLVSHDPKGGKEGTAVLRIVDLRKTTEVWELKTAGEFSTSPAVDRGDLFVGTSTGSLWGLKLADRSSLFFPYAAGGPIVGYVVPAGELLLFGTSQGLFMALDRNTLKQVWYERAPWTSGVHVARATLAGDGVVVAMWKDTSSTISFRDLATGAVRWTLRLAQGLSGEPVVAGDAVYVPFADGAVRGFALGDGERQVFEAKLPAALLGPLACDGRYVYGGGSDGSFYALGIDETLALQQWQVPVTGQIPTGVVVANGDAFFAGASAEGKGDFYILDLAAAADQSAETLVDALDGVATTAIGLHGHSVTFAASGHAATTAYVFDTAEAAMLSRVRFSSRLIVGDYVLEGADQGQPQRPQYQLLVSLADGNGTLEAGVRVDVWASGPDTTVRLQDGREVTLGLTERDALKQVTDSRGQIAMTLEGDLGTSSLFLRPVGFAPGYSIQVFPDQETVTRLSATQATTPGGQGGLQGAKDWSGNDLVKPEYQASLDDVAATIRNTVGRQQNVSASRLTKPAGGAGKAASGPAAAAARGIAPGDVPHWVLEIKPGSASFQAQSAEGIDAIRALAASRASRTKGGFGHFVSHVTKGVHKVAKMTWKHVEKDGARFASVVADTVDELGNVVEQAYEFTVETVEQAVQVLKGVIKDIVHSIEAFIQWLTWLFAWDDILETKHKVKSHVNAFLDAIRDQSAEALASGDLQRFLLQVKQGALQAFGASTQATAGKSVSSTQQSVPSQHEIFHPFGVDITAQANWLIRKLPKPEVVKLKAPSQAIEAVYTAGGAVLDAGRELMKSPAFAHLEADLVKACADVLKLGAGKDGIYKQALQDISAVFADLVEVLFDFVIALAESLLKAVVACMDAVKQILNAEVEIPFVSDFYRLISGGDELRLLDLFALIVAVPVTLTLKLEKETRRAASGAGSGEQATLWTAAGIASVFYGFWASAEWLLGEAEAPAQLKGTMSAIGGVANAIVVTGMAGDARAFQVQDYAYNLMQLVPTGLGVLAFAASHYEQGNNPVWKYWDEGNDIWWGLVGMLTAIQSNVWASLWPDTYFGKNGQYLSVNLVSCLPFFSASEAPWELVAAFNVLGYGVPAGYCFYVVSEKVA